MTEESSPEGEGKKAELDIMEKRIGNLEKAVDTIAGLLMEHEHSSPISGECKMILERGAKEATRDGYRAFTAERRYVLCRAFDLLEKGEAKSFSEAIKKGWLEIKKAE